MPVKDPYSVPAAMRECYRPWLMMANGFIVDARSLPRQAQEIALAKGLIPYIPDDQ